MPSTDRTQGDADGIRYVTIDGERYLLGLVGLVTTTDGRALGRAIHIARECAWAAFPMEPCSGVLAMRRTRTGAIRALMAAAAPDGAAAS